MLDPHETPANDFSCCSIPAEATAEEAAAILESFISDQGGGEQHA